MKRGKLLVLALTFLFAAVAVFFGRNELGMLNFPFSVEITSDGVQEELRCVKIEGEYYLFLPGYADEDNAKISTNLIYDVYIGGQKLERNQSCSDFPVNTKLDLYFRSLENEGHETITFVKSGNTATVCIDVPSGDMEHIHREKGNSEAGWIRIYREDGSLDHTGMLESVKGRGNATWVADKKSYSLELNQEADLLGMGKAGKWILLSNSYDPSQMRNRIAFDMADAADMPYTPDSTWVDLYLNGTYAGLYLLSERNEVHAQRVNIDADYSFLVALEPDWRLEQQGYPYVETEEDIAFRIHYSTVPTPAVQQIWQSAENAIFAADGIDNITGKSWDQIIDVDSWAKKYLLEEILVNEDVGLASEYFYYDRTDALIHAGPVWDMDVTLMDTDEPWLSYRAIMAGRPSLTEVGDRHYFHELLQKEAFRDRVKALYRTEFRPLLQELLDGGVERYARQIEQSALANQLRWQISAPEENAAQIMDFLRERIAFLDSYWIAEDPYYLVQVIQGSRVWAFAVPPGDTLENVPDIAGGYWYRMDTDEIVDKTLPVESDLTLYFKEYGQQ